MSLLREEVAQRYLERIWMVSCALALAGVVVAGFRGGVTLAVSFLLGAVVAVANLRWLEYSVKRVLDSRESDVAIETGPPDTRAENAPSEQASDEGEARGNSATKIRAKPLGLWPKLVARYLFLGAVAYVIFKGYFVSVSAFLCGLFVPVAALMIEAGYEAVAAFRQ
jgi:small-conductance mechanosensitive channel